MSIFWMKKDDLQTIDQICLRSQKNASNSHDTMAKEKGLDKIEVNLPIFSVKAHADYLRPQGWLGPSLTMKTAPLLHRNVSEYTSQCDQGNITVVVCVIRISLYNEDRRFLGGSAKQRSVVASQQTL
jgi:hypothetical protein